MINARGERERKKNRRVRGERHDGTTKFSFRCRGGKGEQGKSAPPRHAVDNLILREDNRAIDANESRISANFAKIIASQTWAHVQPADNGRFERQLENIDDRSADD